MRINARKQNIWLLSSSRFPEWEAVNWHFGVMILISAEYSEMEQVKLFMQSEVNLKKSLNCFFWRKQDMHNAQSCTFTILMQHWGKRKVKSSFCLTKRTLWVNTVDSVCTKRRKVFGQAALDFGYFSWRKSSPGLLHAESVWDYMCALATELSLFAFCLFPSMGSQAAVSHACRKSLVLNTAHFPW